MKSKDTAKMRLIKDTYNPERTIDALQKVNAELKRDLTAKEAELASTQQQLTAAQASNANWQKWFTITVERMEQGRKDERASWRDKLALAGMRLDRYVREEYNRNAFAEAGK